MFGLFRLVFCRQIPRRRGVGYRLSGLPAWAWAIRIGFPEDEVAAQPIWDVETRKYEYQEF
jgi:hypothetical protein